MEESTLILTYAGMGLAVMMIGFIVFLQGAILEHPDQSQILGRRVRTIGARRPVVSVRSQSASEVFRTVPRGGAKAALLIKTVTRPSRLKTV